MRHEKLGRRGPRAVTGGRVDPDGGVMRGQSAATVKRYAIGPLEVIPQDMLVVVAGRRLWLTRRELSVLVVLAERAGVPVARAEIHERVWGEPVIGFKDRSVEACIRRLRVKLAAAAADWEYIHTHHNIGYRLEPEPREDQR
jgi:DNA-binding response OmpR family regulator